MDVAITHKILHHKYPAVFPLLDNKTLGLLSNDSARRDEGGKGRPRNAWTDIHDDLSEHADAFDRLEQWFAGLASECGGPALTRLRLHDIVLWCSAGDGRELAAARDTGREILLTR